MTNPKRIAICLPISWPFVFTDFFLSFVGMTSPTQIRKVSEFFPDGPPLFMYIPGRSFPLDFCRNSLVRAALDNEADYLIFLDADQRFQPDTIFKLVADIMALPDAGAVSGLYYKKLPPSKPVSGMFVNNDQIIYQSQNDEVDGCVPVDVMGMGCCIIRREALLDVGDNGVDTDGKDARLGPWFKYQTLDETDGYPISEDMWFCKKMQDTGWPIYVDTRIKVGHLAVREINQKTYDPYRVEAFGPDGWPWHEEGVDDNGKQKLVPGRGHIRPDLDVWPGSKPPEE